MKSAACLAAAGFARWVLGREGEYSQVWLSENRPYWLSNVTVRYDIAIETWQKRSDLFLTGIRGWDSGRDLPSAASLGLPEPASAKSGAH